MAECPFCGSQVSEDLVTYGGTCPKCFAEIPGEEAATDPGVEVKAALDRRDRRRATLRVVASLSAMMLVVGCTGVAAIVTLLWPEPEVAAILDFDTLDFPIPDIAVAEVEPETPGPRPKSKKPAPSDVAKLGPGTVGPGASAGDLREDGVASLDPARTRTEPGGLITPDRAVVAPRTDAAPSLGGLSLSAPQVRRDDNVVLSDPAAIRDMIGERLIEFVPGLRVCYDRRLKVNPSLKGSWRLVFSVQPTGLVDGVTVSPLGRADGELESCVAEHVRERWRFGRITITQPVSRTLKFYPQ